MTQQLGNTGLPAGSQTRNLEFVRGVGETETLEWRGEKSDTLAKYCELKTDLRTREISYVNSEGRSRVVCKFVRTSETGRYDGNDVTTIEELLGVDIVRAIYASEYFRELDDDEISAVLLAVENRWAEAEIPGYDTWDAKQKDLRWHMLHGQDTFFETLFVLRIRRQGVASSSLRGTFENVNMVTALPSLSVGMLDIVGTLPEGEWLYKPPQVEYVQRGVWSVAQEWNWAPKWSIVYGGTLAMP